MESIAVILAGGRGTRMKQNGSKVLQKICGKPLIEYIIDVLKEKKIEIFVVVSPDSEIPAVITGVNYVVQTEPLGTGHALMQASKVIGSRDVNVFLINGDGPLVDSRLLDDMLNLDACDMKILIDINEHENKFGRILRDDKGGICGIIETKDCTPVELKIPEVNLGVYCFKNSFLVRNIAKIDRNNAQNEYYVTDLINLIYRDGGTILGVDAKKYAVLPSVNTLEELCALDNLMQEDIQQDLIKNGVRLIGSVNIDKTSQIGERSVINPFSVISNSVIGSDCVIGANCVIENCVILSGVTIGSNCVLSGVNIDKNLEIATKLIKN